MTNGNSLPLFTEDIYEALKALVAALGGAKQVALELWPHKPMEQGRKELLDALNRDNPRKLDPEEVMALLKMGRERQFHHAIQWIAAEAGYAAPEPIEPETELTRLLREYLDGRKRDAQLTERIDAKIAAMGVRSVK